jgi:hypothetical protein
LNRNSSVDTLSTQESNKAKAAGFGFESKMVVQPISQYPLFVGKGSAAHATRMKLGIAAEQRYSIDSISEPNAVTVEPT